ncbi:cisplatin damage response ATP-dependent DNA ligase [Parasphingorhabdus cellanae]|uniref:DNA ligase (ATP) n=1 Tax=Parasphingorhabdus cellanae TaxID=2806553 RepID=A0ABX7T8M2_9SPHN|nr:cisplatin damage response ATP-dependent DNA ligase [Parasphingorhabdus cellanae]QTD56293.1 cisplatin damage response ATP-dependent DNA ligase [Parasphingorhabdus cellanae]
MRAFSDLIDSLIYTRSRNGKLRLISDYLKEAADPDRGWVLAALTGELDFPTVKASAVRNMAMERVDETLFKLSRDFVGDTAETVALIWPGSNAISATDTLTVGKIVDELAAVSRLNAPKLLANLMDQLGSNERYALLKLATGGMRVGVSARLAKTAFAQAFDMAVEDIEEVWHALSAPYPELFAWGEGEAERPDLTGVPFFRPFMLAHPLENKTLDLEEYASEWKWDGIRIQIVGTGQETKLFSRGGDDITAAFPDIADAFQSNGVVDGELLVRGEFQGGEAASFNALQQRLGRKKVSKKMLEEYPAFVRLYDILYDGEVDLREQSWSHRRQKLESLVPKLDAKRFDISTILEARDFAHLSEIREGARDAAIEGVMLKRRDSPYISGRKTGLWYKWKRDPLVADCVMMYAQRGSGKRSSFYSDYTFGCWTDDGELYPVGKAYSGFTDEELKMLDKFVRQNTLNRFGPVREVDKTMVLEVAFDSIHKSKRHKSGLAMRFPRISRIRLDKPAAEADQISTLEKMIT